MEPPLHFQLGEGQPRGQTSRASATLPQDAQHMACGAAGHKQEASAGRRHACLLYQITSLCQTSGSGEYPPGNRLARRLGHNPAVGHNAWNRNIIPWWLLLPWGVSGAIKRRGGTGPFKELRRQGAIPLGGAVLTSAGKLPFKPD